MILCFGLNMSSWNSNVFARKSFRIYGRKSIHIKLDLCKSVLKDIYNWLVKTTVIHSVWHSHTKLLYQLRERRYGLENLCRWFFYCQNVSWVNETLKTVILIQRDFENFRNCIRLHNRNESRLVRQRWCACGSV